MYIYELPFDVNKELCRLLDIDDVWKELAGEQMRYSPFDINEMEQKAKRYSTSPTQQLFTSWGQLNHKTEELFVLLYHMKHVPAMRCLAPIVDARFLRLLHKLDGTKKSGENGNIKEVKPTHQPILIHKDPQRNGIVFNGQTPSDQTSEISKNITTNSKANDVNNELNKVAAIPIISYEELRVATNDWSDANLLGRGGFGTVYKGEWKHLPVAVKKLQHDEGRYKELIREMCVNQYRHDNILPLYGYSMGGPQACLVYQLMAGGSLEQRLKGAPHPPLTWPQRYRIAHGVARGLQFLHNMEGTPLIHGDVKPANILLDQCLMPKIGDFGLARKGPFSDDRTDVKVSKVYGTYAYLPLDYLRSHVISPAVDVFSFGVLSLEMATALPAHDNTRKPPFLTLLMHALNKNNFNFFTLEDPMVRGTAESNPNLCWEFISIGLHCTQENRHDRPTMLEVYKRLDALQYPGKFVP